MLELALWLKQNGYRADQVQAFLPGPMATATAMWHSGKNPLRKVTRDGEDVVAVKGLKQRRLHKAFLRYHDPNNWPLLREALHRMGRAELIGNGKKHLVPRFQPKDTGDRRRQTQAGVPHAARPLIPGSTTAVAIHHPRRITTRAKRSNTMTAQPADPSGPARYPVHATARRSARRSAHARGDGVARSRCQGRAAADRCECTA